MSGPVFSDVEQGCIVPLASAVTICGQNNGNQWGCKLGSDTTWNNLPQYVNPAIGWVGGWTNDSSCANSPGTSQASNTRWLQQSIVDDGTNNPVFSYPHTAMAGWLCRTVQSGQTMNNSSAQGQYYYSTITANGAQPSNYAVYSVDSCYKGEGVAAGTVSALSNEAGLDAIKYDMTGGGPQNQVRECVHSH